jgi:pyruvate/2-oxoglutarate dehydrogenase complex dihydrolipoamide dehydrogenase (E3) component
VKRSFDYDVVVIGSGSAGFAAARTAAALGARTAIIEAGLEMAGLCILRGCMPSKALLACSNRMHAIRTAHEFGIERARGVANLTRMVMRKKRLVAEFARYREKQIRHGKFKLIRGRARFQDGHTVAVSNGRKITAQSFIVCTGSHVAQHPFDGLAQVHAMDSDAALDRRRLPKSLAVLGGGPIALELGQYFARLGSRVTILQRSGQVLSKSDEDLAVCLEKSFEREGIRVLTGVRLERFERRAAGKVVHFKRARRAHRLAVDEILYALGRTPNTAGLGLETIGVKLRGAAIAVDRTMRSSVPHIFAAGDVNGEHEVVHIAIQQAELAARNAVNGVREKIDERAVALAVFTEPQIATVGRSERELKGKKFLTAKYPFDDHGKSMVMGETAGFVKIIAEPVRGKILGAQCIGPEASDLIHEMIALVHLGATVFDAVAIPHYHPTLSEIWTYPAEEIVEVISSRRLRASRHTHSRRSKSR